VIGVVVVVLLLVGGVFAFLALTAPTPPVQVAEIDLWAPDNVCGLNSNPSYFDGFNSSTGANQTFEFYMPDYNSTACTIHGVTTNTSGFALTGVQVPLTIPGGENSTLNITITSPPSTFSGDLRLVLS
jgi:hypothetical protein